MKIRIKNKYIGDKNPAFIIAEFGINHNGRPGLAIRMVREAAEAGVDAVKLQVVNPEESYSKDTASYGIFRKFCLNFEAIRMIRDEAIKNGLIFFATAGDLSSLDMLLKLKVSAIKVSSGCMTNVPLIRRAAATGLPVIISTGMSYLKEVKGAVSELEKNGARDIVILHCVSSYPSSYEDINLNSMTTLKNIFRYPVGYSDHTKGSLAAIVAVAMGAKVIEKHFTLNKKFKGPDHHFSATPREMRQLAVDIRTVERIMGSYIKQPTKSEKKIIAGTRRFIVTARNLSKGEVIKEQDIFMKRLPCAADMLPCERYDDIIGRKAAEDIRKDTPISARLLR